MTTVTELPDSQGDSSQPVKWCIQLVSNEASTARIIRAAEPNRRHWIEKIIITSSGDQEWIKIMDGDSDFIGPISGKEGLVWPYEFHRNIHGVVNSDLKVMTETDFPVHVIIEGHTDVFLEKAFNPTPADNATGFSVNGILEWDSSPQTSSHNVYINDVLVSTQSEDYYSPSLGESTTYTWRIDDSDGDNTVTGDTWTFTTE